MYACMGVRNVSFSKKFCVRIKWMTPKKKPRSVLFHKFFLQINFLALLILNL